MIQCSNRSTLFVNAAHACYEFFAISMRFPGTAGVLARLGLFRATGDGRAPGPNYCPTWRIAGMRCIYRRSWVTDGHVARSGHPPQRGCWRVQCLVAKASI